MSAVLTVRIPENEKAAIERASHDLGDAEVNAIFSALERK